MILVLLTKVLSLINVAPVYLLSEDADLLKAVHHLKISFNAVSDYHNNFTDAIDEATRICHLWGDEPEF